jgi:hypothetical protein
MLLRNRNREDLQHGLKKLPTSCGLCLSPELLRSNNREPVTFSPAIPYSYQASRIGTGHLIDPYIKEIPVMKSTKRSNIYLPMAAMILTAALAMTAVAQNQVPFKGAMQGNDTDTAFTNTTVTVLTVGTGVGTHVGQFSFTQQITVNFADGTDTGSAHWIAANGDSFDTTIAGSGEPTDTPGVIRITEIHTITGGTGRFAGAQGSFTMERMASGITFLTSGSFHGTVTSPGAAH